MFKDQIIHNKNHITGNKCNILYRVDGTCRVYRLHHSIVHTLLLPTPRVGITFISLQSILTPLISCVRAVFRCLPSSKASCSSTDCFLRTDLLLKVKVKVTLRLTVSQSVSLGVQPHLGLMTRYLLLFDSYGLVFVWRPL
jgi:hypothetical protein